MSALSGNRRRLNPSKVYVAQKTAVAKIEIAKKVVLERAEKDAKFAADVLKAVGSELTDEARAICEKSVKDAKDKAILEKWEKTGLLNGTGSIPSNPPIFLEPQAKELDKEITDDMGNAVEVKSVEKQVLDS